MRWLSMIRRNPFVLPMAVVAGLAMFFISEGSYWQSVDTITDLRGIASARQDIATLERALADAETAQHGYLLTGQEDYLKPYRDSRPVILDALSQLESRFSVDTATGVALAEVRVLAKLRLDEVDTTVQLVQTDQRPAALQLVMTGQGKQTMDRLRAITRQLTTEQTALRQSTNRLLDRTLLLSRYGVALLSAVLIVALVLYLRKSDALATVQTTKKAELQAANDGLEAEVSQRTLQLTALTRHLLTAREDERHRLARNLHDDLGSLLTAAKLDAARIRSRLGAGAPEAQARLADLVVRLDSSIALGRSIIEDLRPSTLSHLGLTATLEILATEFSNRTNVPVHCKFESVRLKLGVELVVYRVVQEAITNLSKYAHAKNVWITVAPSPSLPDIVDVSVRDDGTGFDTEKADHDAFGLLGMRFRVEAEGGTLRVSSRPGRGTHVEVTLPALPKDA